MSPLLSTSSSSSKKGKDNLASVSLPGAHVLITGGASGIGAALADACAAAGAGAVSLLDSDARGAAAAAALLREGNPGLFAAAFVCDVTSSEQVFAAVRAATEAHGPITFLFANAGIGPCGLFLEGCEKKSASAAASAVAAATAATAAGSSKKKAGAATAGAASAAAAAAASAALPPPPPSLSCPWQKTMAVNYGGVVSVLQAALPGMVQAGRGRVVVTGSMGGFMGAAGLSAYSASKHALRGLCDCLRLELLPTGVSIHLATPGFVDTPMLRASQAAASPAAQRLSAALSPPLSDAESTAKAILKGTLSGRYLIPTDARSRSLVAAVAAASASAPGVLPWPLAALLAPLLVLLATLVRFGMEIGTKRALLENGGGGGEAGVVEEGGKGLGGERAAGASAGASVAVSADGRSGGDGSAGSKRKA